MLSILLSKILLKYGSPIGSVSVKTFSHLTSMKRLTERVKMYAKDLLRAQEMNWTAAASEKGAQGPQLLSPEQEKTQSMWGTRS